MKCYENHIEVTTDDAFLMNLFYSVRGLYFYTVGVLMPFSRNTLLLRAYLYALNDVISGRMGMRMDCVLSASHSTYHEKLRLLVFIDMSYIFIIQIQTPKNDFYSAIEIETNTS